MTIHERLLKVSALEIFMLFVDNTSGFFAGADKT